MTNEEFEDIIGKPVGERTTFYTPGDFAAFYEAKEYCKSLGFSVGSMQREAPIGLAKGDCLIAKWHNIARLDKRCLDGVIVGGDMRNGPVEVIIAHSSYISTKLY